MPDGLKNQNLRLPGLEKNPDDNLSRFDTIPECDGQTDDTNH